MMITAHTHTLVATEFVGFIRTPPTTESFFFGGFISLYLCRGKARGENTHGECDQLPLLYSAIQPLMD